MSRVITGFHGMLGAALLLAGQASAQPVVQSLTRDTLGNLGLTRSDVMATSWPAFAAPVDGQRPGPETAARGADTASAFHADVGGGATVWGGGVYTRFDSSFNGLITEGDAYVAQGGFDVRVGDDLRLGLMAAAETIDGVIGAIDADASGFLVGPYAVLGVGQFAHVEALALGGMTYNDYDAGGGLRAEFAAARILLSAGLSAEWTHNDISIRPSARLIYYAEQHEAYADTNLNAFAGETTSVGQLRLGQELGYAMTLGDGAYAAPFVGVEGVWAFHQSAVSANGRLTGADELSASVSFGVDALFGETSLRLNGRFDGLGADDFDAATAEAQVRVPLN